MACTKGRESAASQLFANCFPVAFLGSSSGRLRRRDSRQQIPCLAALTRSTWAFQNLGSVKFHRDFPNFWGFWLIQLILPSRIGLKFTLCNQWIWWSVQKMFAKLVAILIGFKNSKIICRLLDFSSKFQSKLGGRFDAVVEMTNSVGPKLCSVRSQVGQIGYPPRGYQRLAVTWILGR